MVPDLEAALYRVKHFAAPANCVRLQKKTPCAKSTTLRMITGLEDISAGELHIGDRMVNNLPPKDREVAMVFQSYALYPHMTIYDNIAFGLKIRKTPQAEVDQLVKEASDILGLNELLDRKPRQLSGGQRQRVALGRAIVRKPRVFLFDEPLSNLDAKRGARCAPNSKSCMSVCKLRWSM